MQTASDQATRYRWGIALAWVPLIVFYVFGLRNAFRGIIANKATGLGAVAGGFVEGMTILGIVSLFSTQIGSIVLLSRTFSKVSGSRAALSIVTIGLSFLAIALTAGSLWLLFHHGVF